MPHSDTTDSAVSIKNENKNVIILKISFRNLYLYLHLELIFVRKIWILCSRRTIYETSSGGLSSVRIPHI